MKSIFLVLFGFFCATAVLPWEGKPKVLNFWHQASHRRVFENLTDEQKAVVREHYEALLKAYEQKDFSHMKENAEKILARVPDFNDTKSYLQIAERKLAEISH